MILTPIASAIRSPIRSPFDPRRSGASGPVNSATAWYFASLGLAGTPWADVSRTGLGTRVDSAGLVRQGPHNLIQQSENVSAGIWSKAQSATTPDAETIVFAALSESRVEQSGAALQMTQIGDSATVQVEMRADVPMQVNLSAGGDRVYTTVNVTTQWQRFTATRTRTGAGTENVFAIIANVGAAAGTVKVRRIGINLGPTAFDYIPTTTTARYLPRITHDPALDINGVPYTVTEQYGPERITNGTFATNTTGWSLVGAGGALAAVSGELEISGSGGGYPGVRQTLTGLTVGATYRLTCSARRGTTAQNVTVFAGSASVTVTAAASTPVAFFFVASSTSANVEILINAAAASGTAYVDNVSVQEYLGTVTSGTPRPLGLLVEGQGTNLYPVSDTPSTRTVTVTAAAHTISVYGTCTITLSGAATGTLTATGAANIRTTLTFTPSAGSLTMTVSGLTTGNRAQLEASSVATSYIPNPGTGSAVRVADGTWDLTGAAFAAAWNQPQGTLYFEWIAPNVGFTQDIIMAHLAGNISESLGLYTSGGAVLSMWVRSGGANQANFSVANNIIAGARNKAAFSWGPSGFALVLNGGTVATGAGTVPSPSALRLAGPTLVSGGVLSGIVATSYTRPTQLTGAALQALTA